VAAIEERAPFRPGDRVIVRRQRWRILHMGDPASEATIGLAGLGGSNAGEQRTLLAPFEVIEPAGPTLRSWVTGRRRWRRACRALLSRDGGWTAVRRAELARLDIMPHQLEPVLALLQGQSCRVLLADAVGLGKTIQAGLIVAELLARGAIEHALLVTPAGLRDQWALELSDRFGLSPTIVDLATARQLTARVPIGVNPWDAVQLALVSLDYIKRAEVEPSVRRRYWDLVVVDEAHVVTPDTDRYAAVSALCADALFVVLVTATPHSGDRRAFDALCALGRQDDRLLIFRRMRSDVRLNLSRHVHRRVLGPSGAEHRMHAALARYAHAVRHEGRGADGDGALLLAVLEKRALSSPESLRRSVARRLRAIDETSHRHVTDSAPDTDQLRLPLDDGDGELDVSDVPPALERPVLCDTSRERRLLAALLEAATAAVAGETKLAALARLLRRLARLGESAIVFTEYRDTLFHVQRTLACDAVLLHGGLSRAERQASIDRFAAGRSALLLATDAGSEGLNLHHRCRCVVHLELPWNPTRLEQRTGRVDRVGQKRTVHAFYLVAKHRTEEALMERLRARIGRAQADVGFADPLTGSDSPASPGRRRFKPSGTEVRAVPTAVPIGAETEPKPCEDAIDVVRPDLRATAAAEAARIDRVRALFAVAKDGCDARADPADHVIACARRSRGTMCRVLDGRSLLLLGVSLEDAAGRVVASRTRALLISRRASEDGGTEPRRHYVGRRRGIRRCLPSDELLDAVSAAESDWIAGNDPAGIDHGAFWARSLSRALAIVRRADGEHGSMFQPGLFDRRADRHRAHLIAADRDMARRAELRLARLEHAAIAPTAAVRTRLVLLP